ncbi:MAG: DUF4352 domain-containing protein [Candidatus Nanohaloarchaea archaeon]
MDITLGKMASWFFGVILILAGLGSLTMSVSAAIVYFLTGLFLIPNVRQEIDERYDVAFSRWVVVLIAVIGIGLGGALMQGNMDSTTTPVNDNTNNQQPAQDTNNQEQTSDNQMDSGNQQNTQNTRESRTHSVGSEFTVGDVRYQVNRVSTRQRIGQTTAGTFMGAEANGQYFIVDLSVMNQADESIRMRTSSLKVVIDGAKYSPDTGASVYMDDSFTFEQLNPGVQVDGQIAYDVPASATVDSAELKVNPVGLFSTAEPHYVDLSS